MWSGRTSEVQNHVYNHESDEELDEKALIVGIADNSRNIIPVTAEEFENIAGTSFASKTSTGFCVQSLHVNPCTHLQVGLSGCTGCTKHCYIKGDKNSLATLKEDLYIQVQRIQDDSMTARNTNPIMKKWYDTHITNIEFLHTLIKLLQRNDILDGAIIRYVKENQFNVVIDGVCEKHQIDFELPSSIKKLVDQSNNELSLPAKKQNSEKSAFDLLLESASVNTSSKGLPNLRKV